MINMTLKSIFALSVISIAIAGCGGKKEEDSSKSAPVQAAVVSVTFKDVTKEAGIDFKHTNGGFGKKWLPETMGSGLAWIDFDNDGYQDLYLVNSREWTSGEKSGGKEIAQARAPCATKCSNRCSMASRRDFSEPSMSMPVQTASRSRTSMLLK